MILVNDSLHSAFPTAARRSNGHIWVPFRRATSHTNSKGDIHRCVSTDGGNSFGAHALLFTDPTWDLRCAALAELRDGVIVSASSLLHPTTGVTPNILRRDRSIDGGASWQTDYLTGPLNEWVFCGEGPPIDLPNGDILLPVYAKGTASPNWSAGVLRSTDRGLTFPIYHQIANGPAAGVDWSEIVVKRCADGVIRALIRREGTPWELWRSQSADNGTTWTTPVKAFDGHGRPHFTQRPDRSYISYHRGTNGATVFRTSSDFTTWSSPTQIAGSFMTYADSVLLPDGRLGLAYAVESSQSQSSVSWEFVGSAITGQNVAQTNPTGGAMDPGSTVEATLDTPPALQLQIPVPNLTGWAWPAASLMLEQMGFVAALG